MEIRLRGYAFTIYFNVASVQFVLSKNPFSFYILLDLGARLRDNGSGERFPRFVEYSAKHRPRCRILGRQCPRIVPRR